MKTAKMRYLKVEMIENYMKRNNLSKMEFAERCGFSLKTLNNILNKKGNVGILSVLKTAKAMGVELKDLF